MYLEFITSLNFRTFSFRSLNSVDICIFNDMLTICGFWTAGIQNNSECFYPSQYMYNAYTQIGEKNIVTEKTENIFPAITYFHHKMNICMSKPNGSHSKNVTATWCVLSSERKWEELIWILTVQQSTPWKVDSNSAPSFCHLHQSANHHEDTMNI